ncbi:MAG TPA: hypothetical protein VEQ63_05605 [Bryobacteraceae bacterium]|nr:hypothetical protein [Bryobacteraceae bacterium]
MPTPASPGTNQFRCNACGRYLNDESDLRSHEFECRAAKAASESGRRDLEIEDHTPHEPNDADTKQRPFEHGTGAPKE